MPTIYTQSQLLSYERETATSRDIYCRLKSAEKVFLKLQELKNQNSFKNLNDCLENIRAAESKINVINFQKEKAQEKLFFYEGLKTTSKNSLISTIEMHEINIESHGYLLTESDRRKSQETISYYRELLNIKNKGPKYLTKMISYYENKIKSSNELIETNQTIIKENKIESESIKQSISNQEIKATNSEIMELENKLQGRPQFGYSETKLLSNLLYGYFDKYSDMKDDKIIKTFESLVSSLPDNLKEKNILQSAYSEKIALKYIEAFANKVFELKEDELKYYPSKYDLEDENY